MYNCYMKKFLIGIVIFIATIFLWFSFCDVRIKLFPASTIGQEHYNKLFDYCSAQIPVSSYPKDIQELTLNKYAAKDKYLLYDKLNNMSEGYLKEVKLFELLGDKVAQDNRTSFVNYFLKDNEQAHLYFDYNGNLMLIKKETGLSNNYINYQCKYSKNGNLIEAIFTNNDKETHFNSEKNFIYSVFASHFGDSISKDYAKYIIN